MKKHFVTFASPGTFFAEETTREIDSWSPSKAVQMAKDITERYNAKPYGFYFTTRERGDNDFDSKQTERSKMYFLGGKILTLAEVEARKNPDDRILISNMKGNGWNRVIENTNSWKVTLPFTDGDTLVNMQDFDVYRK